MTTIHRSALVPYSAAEMYALVNDIEAYPAFLPWCRSARIDARHDNKLRATLEFARGGIHKSFTTLNSLHENSAIEVSLVEGPFRHLQGLWNFQNLQAQACKISLKMDFEFSTKMLALVIGPVFHPIVASLVEAFHQRAREVYGER